MRAPGRTVSVAASNTISEALLPVWASRLRRTHPDTSLNVFPGNSQDVIDAVTAGRVDIGFVETSSIPRGLGSQVVGHDELVVVVPPDHPWTRRRGGIDRQEVSATPLILREAGSGTRDHVDQAIPGHVPAAHTFPSTAAVRDAVRTTGIPTILSSLAIEGDLATGRLSTITVRDLSMPRTLHAIWHPRQRPRGPAANLLRIASEALTAKG
ncbi:LysR substrate-binding domain-containing protein [Dermatophilaceae bacterium Soc4.6]